MKYKISIIAKKDFKNKFTNQKYKKGVSYIKKITLKEIKDLLLIYVKNENYKIIDLVRENKRIGV